MPARKDRRFVFVSDTHGDNIDPHVASIFWSWMKDWKPDIRIAGGDHFDFRWLRSKASDNEKAEAIEADISAGLDFIRLLKPTHFLYGNHDDRLNRAKESYIGAVKGLGIHIQEEIDAALGDAKVYPYCKRNGVLRIGDVSFIHGFGTGIQSLRKATMSYGNVVQGHLHTVETYTVERLDASVGRSAGCLCKLDLGYNAAHLATLRQRHGWAYGIVRPNGRTVVWQASCEGGVWLLPSGVKQWTAGIGSSKPSASSGRSGSDSQRRSKTAKSTSSPTSQPTSASPRTPSVAASAPSPKPSRSKPAS